MLKVCGSQRPEKPLYSSQRRPRRTEQGTSEPVGSAHCMGGSPFDEASCVVHLGMLAGPKGGYQVLVPKAFLEEEGISRKSPRCLFSCLDWGQESGQGSQGTGRTEAWTLGPVGGLHPSYSAFLLVGMSPINHGRENISLPGRTRCPSVQTSA